MKFNSIINNFSSGVWSPKMLNRADTEEYFKSCEELLNMIPQLQGGAFRRPGTKYIDLGTAQGRLEQGYSTRIIPWRLSTGQKYLIVMNTEAPTNLPSRWFIYNTVTGVKTDLSATSGADFADTNLMTAQFEQVGDIVYFVTDGMPPRFISYAGGVPYVYAYHEYFGGLAAQRQWETVPYKPISAEGDDGTLTVTGTFTVGGAVTVTSSTSRFSSFMLPAYGAGRGLFIKVSSASSTGVVEMTGYTSDTVITGVVRSVVPGASPLTVGSAAGTSFEIAAWNGRDGWPRTIAAFEQRLYFGGNTSFPDTIWGSRAGTQLDMMEVPFQQSTTFSTFTSDNARPWSAALAVTSQAYQIQSMAAAKTLEIHTLKADIVAYGGNGNILGPVNKSFESSTSFGSDYVQPVRVNNFSSFVQRGGRKVRDIVFNFNEDQYKSSDLMFMADHYTYRDPIVKVASVEYGSTSLMLAISDAGKVYACAIDRDYKMNAWHEWALGGDTVRVTDIAVVPTAGEYDSDSVFMVVTRTINGVDAISIEQLSDLFEGTDYDFYGLGVPFYFLDSWVAKTPGSPTNTITGLSRLEGETVGVFGDNFYLGEYDVSGGEILLPNARYGQFIVGFNSTARLKINPIQAGAQFGTPVNQVKAAAKVVANFYKTLSASYKTTGTPDTFNIPFREPSVPGNEATPVFTGEKVLSLPPNIGRKIQIEFETSDPYPMNILSLVFEGVTND